MLVMTVKVGEALQLGEVAVIKVLEKQGQRVKLAIASQVSPIALIPDGIIPTRFTFGVTGEQRSARGNLASLAG